MEVFLKFIEILLIGDMRAVVLILTAIIAALIWDRLKLIKQIAEKTDKIDHIIENYHESQMSIVKSLNDIKMAIYEIKNRK